MIIVLCGTDGKTGWRVREEMPGSQMLLKEITELTWLPLGRLSFSQTGGGQHVLEAGQTGDRLARRHASLRSSSRWMGRSATSSSQ